MKTAKHNAGQYLDLFCKCSTLHMHLHQNYVASCKKSCLVYHRFFTEMSVYTSNFYWADFASDCLSLVYAIEWIYCKDITAWIISCVRTYNFIEIVDIKCALDHEWCPLALRTLRKSLQMSQGRIRVPRFYIRHFVATHFCLLLSQLCAFKNF